MSFSSDLLERSVEVEHPVTVILLSDEEEEEEGDRRRIQQKHEDRRPEERDSQERTIEVVPIGLHPDEPNWEIKFRRGSTDWSVKDSDPFLAKVNVVVDTDEERKHDDDDDDDYNNDEYDDTTSTTMSELFRGSTGSQIFRDASGCDVFLSADNSAVSNNVGIQGQLTRRKFEVVEHETTRKCIILAPNTELDSDNEQREELLTATRTPDQSAYDEAAALYHSSIKDQGSILPVLVFKMDSETQTSRNRTTQTTGVDQSTMTDEELMSQGLRKRRRRRRHERNPDEEGTGQQPEAAFRKTRLEEENNDYREQGSAAFDDQGSRQVTGQSRRRPRGGRPHSRGEADNHEFLDDGHSTGAAAAARMVSVGQQTASHVTTQTPVIVRLDANGTLWMPQDAMLLAGIEHISAGTERFFYLLDNRTPDCHDNQAPPRCRGNEGSKTREFSTQTFGQLSRDVIPAETQTSPGNSYLDNGEEESRRSEEMHGLVLRREADWTSKDARHQRKHDKRKKNGHERIKRLEREKGRNRSPQRGDIEREESGDDDELKTDLLKLMLHQIKTLKRQVNKVDEDNGKKEERDERSHHRSPKGLQMEVERSRNEQRQSSKGIKDSVDRVRKWKKQLDTVGRNYFQRDDLEGRGNRRRSVDRDWLSADEVNTGRSRRNQDVYHPGNGGTGRSFGHSRDMERIHRSLTLPPPSRGHDLFHQSKKYSFSNSGTHTKHDVFRGHRHYPNHDVYPGSRPHPFRPLGTSSPAIVPTPGRASRSDLDLRHGRRRSSGSPAVGLDIERSEGRRKGLEGRGGDQVWKEGGRENVDPNSKRHLLLLSTTGHSSRRQHRI